MIISTHISVTISSNGAYYKKLGYGLCKQRDVISVKLEDIPLNSNKTVQCKCDRCFIGFERGYQMIKRTESVIGVHLCKECSYKHRVETIDYTGVSRSNSSRLGPKHPGWNPNKSEYKKYCNLVDRHTRKQDISILENYDKLRGLCGVEGAYQLDHIISKKYGFHNKITPEQIGCISNLRFIPWEENRKKWHNVESDFVTK